jgi:hypothetical protein
VSLSFAYRNDALLTNYAVPLLFYADAGVDYYVWSGDGAFVIDGDGSGGTSGIHAGAGVGLDLDFGNHDRKKSYETCALVFYIGQSWIDDFGGDDGGHHDFSATHLRLGLTIDI